MMEATNYPKESLSDALLALIRQQVAAFLIFWLLVNVPVICQYHSIMTPWDVVEDTHHSHHQPQPQDNQCSLHNHDASGHIMSLLDAFVAIIPINFVIKPGYKSTEHSISVDEWPLEPVIPPPEQPPRAA